jgi:hypothetical protein
MQTWWPAASFPEYSRNSRLDTLSAVLCWHFAHAGNLAVTLSFDGLLLQLGLSGTYLLYGLANVAAALYVGQLLVETRCRWEQQCGSLVGVCMFDLCSRVETRCRWEDERAGDSSAVRGAAADGSISVAVWLVSVACKSEGGRTSHAVSRQAGRRRVRSYAQRSSVGRHRSLRCSVTYLRIVAVVRAAGWRHDAGGSMSVLVIAAAGWPVNELAG